MFAQENTIEFTDRYKALGIPYPDPETICKGECEGIGWIPVLGKIAKRKGSVIVALGNESDLRLMTLWQQAHDSGNFVQRFIHRFRCDGWHFVKCPDCNGTGKRN